MIQLVPESDVTEHEFSSGCICRPVGRQMVVIGSRIQGPQWVAVHPVLARPDEEHTWHRPELTFDARRGTWT